MCTKAEVKEVVSQAVVPAWARAVLSAAIMGCLATLGWSALTIQKQTSSIQNLEKSTIVRDTELTGQISHLISEINNLKNIALERNKIIYTNMQASSRNLLVDERCKNMRKQVEENHKAINNLEKVLNSYNNDSVRYKIFNENIK